MVVSVDALPEWAADRLWVNQPCYLIGLGVSQGTPHARRRERGTGEPSIVTDNG
jgi:hypothetical protein